ncbi:hypothetical protein KR026_001317 [Drosophila bipectinata]|nr:hypothetical protein KR026_001317 [Drosophila bipectinata]
MGDEDSSIICIDSDSDSDATVVFVPKKRTSRAKRAAEKQLLLAPQTEIDINPFFSARQLYRLRKIIFEKYNAIKQASEKIQNIVDANGKLSDSGVESSLTKTYINAISMRWELEIRDLKADHDRVANALPNSSSQAQNAEELLKMVKRMRWCSVCLNPAEISDQCGLFFCSIDCQLEKIDA